MPKFFQNNGEKFQFLQLVLAKKETKKKIFLENQGFIPGFAQKNLSQFIPLPSIGPKRIISI